MNKCYLDLFEFNLEDERREETWNTDVIFIYLTKNAKNKMFELKLNNDRLKN